MACNFVLFRRGQNFSLHTHTIGFDGQNTPADMVAAAQQVGLRHLGISNHFIVHPDITKSKFYPFAVRGGYKSIYSSSFDEAIAKFKPHYEELNRLADTSDIKIYRGMEVDFFDYPEWRAGFEQAIKILKPDYIIGASHFVEMDGELHNVHDFSNADNVTRTRLLISYWTKLGRAAESGLFNFMAHLDLPKKTGCGTEYYWVEEEQNVIDKLAETKTPIEINTSFYNRSDEPYPSARILKMVAASNVPVLLSDDAHQADFVGRHFERAYDFARSCGVKKFLTCRAILRKTR